MTLPDTQSEPDESLLSPVEGGSSHAIPPLPMNPKKATWPNCFASVRLSDSGDFHEVLLNEGAGDQSGKIWKIYPSPFFVQIESLVSGLKNREPFCSDPNLSDDLDTLLEFSQLWCIDDGFVNHSDRRSFLEGRDDVSKYLEHTSKLRRNAMNYLPMAADSLSKRFPSIKNDFLINLGQVLGQNNYDEKDFEQKREFVFSVDDQILDYLKQLSTQQ